MLKLKLQYFGYLMQRADLFEKPWCWERLKVRKGDDRGWGSMMASPTQWTWVWVNSRSCWWTGRPGVLAVHGVAKSRTQLSDWTELNWTELGAYWLCVCLCMGAHVCSVTKSCLTLCNLMDFSQAPVHRIFQVRILEWVAISFSRRYSRPRDGTHVSCIGRQILYQ